MIRSGGAVSLGRASRRLVSSTKARTPSSLAYASKLRQRAPRFIDAQNRAPLALVPRKPFSTSLQRYATQPGNPFDKIDKKHEEALEHEKIEPHPEEVSASSSVHQVFAEKGVEEPEKDEDMLAGVKADLVGTISSANWSNALIIGATANDKGDLCPR